MGLNLSEDSVHRLYFRFFSKYQEQTYFHKAHCEIREVCWKSRGGLRSLLSGFCHFMTGTKLWFNIFITCE